MSHDAMVSAVPHEPSDHAHPRPTTEAHGRTGLQHLPWILAGFLGLAALVEGVFYPMTKRSPIMTIDKVWLTDVDASLPRRIIAKVNQGLKLSLGLSV